jgi:hypothetical protein
VNSIAGPLFSVECLVCNNQGRVFQIECPGCNGKTVLQSLFESQPHREAYTLRSIEVPCKACGASISFEDIIDKYPPFGPDESSQFLAICGNGCLISDSEESAVLFGDKWVCLSCHDVCGKEEVWACEQCRRLVTGETPQSFCLGCAHELEEFEDEPPGQPPSEHVM